MSSKRKKEEVGGGGAKKRTKEEAPQTVSPHDFGVSSSVTVGGVNGDSDSSSAVPLVNPATSATTLSSFLTGSDHHYSNTEGKATVLDEGAQAQASQKKEKVHSSDSIPHESADHDATTDELHLMAGVGDMIGGRFEVLELMGMGTFGRVYKCKDFKHNDVVALKCIRAISKYIDSAVVETKILNQVYRQQYDQLKQQRIEREYCVKLYTRVYHDTWYCMAFEPLGPSLLDVLKWNDFRGLPLTMVANIGYQLMDALKFLGTMGLAHTDLKLENILFVDQRREDFNIYGRKFQEFHFFGYSTEAHVRPGPPGRAWCPIAYPYLRLPQTSSIKLIDFGGANFIVGDHKKKSIVNTRQYRGPEVVLETGWSLPSDMWSAGCLLAEIWTGSLLFATHDNLEHLVLMEKLLGPFPEWMIRHTRVRRSYFHSDYSIRSDELSASQVTKVADLLPLTGASYECDKLAALLKRMLHLDPNLRVMPKDALRDPFFLMRTNQTNQTT